MRTIRPHDCNSIIEDITRRLEEIAPLNCKYLEPLDELPHMELRFHQQFIDTYTVTVLGFGNVSLILQGILLEMLLKELIYYHEEKEFQKDFGRCIKRCIDKKYLNKWEIDYLIDFKNMIRNIYLHGDVTKLTQKSTAPVFKIPINKKDVAKSILKGIENVKKGKMRPQSMSPKELRVLGPIFKDQIDEDNYYNQFLFMDLFVRNIYNKYMQIKELYKDTE